MYLPCVDHVVVVWGVYLYKSRIARKMDTSFSFQFHNIHLVVVTALYMIVNRHFISSFYFRCHRSECIWSNSVVPIALKRKTAGTSRLVLFLLMSSSNFTSVVLCIVLFTDVLMIEGK